MSNTIVIKNLTQVNGKNLADNRTITTDDIGDYTEPLVAGKSGTIDGSAVVTLAEGHGYTDASILACSWSTGRRYNCTVTAYDSTSVTLATGAGDTLPTSGTVTLAAKVEIACPVNGTKLDYLFIGSDVNAVITLEDAEGVELAIDVGAGAAYSWSSDLGTTNPVTGDTITDAHCFNKGLVVGNIQILYGFDN